MDLSPILTHSDFYTWAVKKCDDTEEGMQMTVKYKKEKWEDMGKKGERVRELFLDFSILGHFLHWLLSSTSAHWLTSLLFIFHLQTYLCVWVYVTVCPFREHGALHMICGGKNYKNYGHKIKNSFLWLNSFPSFSKSLAYFDLIN